MFSCEFYEILSNTDFEEHLRIAGSVVTYTTTEKEKKKHQKKFGECTVMHIKQDILFLNASFV